MIYASKKGKITWEEMVILGWGLSTDPALAGRLIIPIRQSGKLQNYLARSLPSMQLTPKEMSGSEDDGWVPRSKLAVGLEEVKTGEICALVEGIWDKCWLDKTSNSFRTVATLGHILHPVVAGKILTKEPSKIVVFYDGDEAGVEGTFQAVNYLLSRNFHEVRVARPPAGRDPNELTDNQILSLIAASQPGPVWMVEQAAKDGKGLRKKWVRSEDSRLSSHTQPLRALRWKDQYRG